MVLNTLTVGAAVTPAVIETAISHYIKRKPLRGKPTAHISYDEGLHLVRQFLEHASNHTVDEVQAFTAQWVPSPRWVRTEEVTIPSDCVTKAADHLVCQLGPHGVEAVGGSEWWQWRPEQHPLKGEWIEMRKDYHARKAENKDASRIILYIHGGAYYFGSVDEHRYQLSRHARKLKARLLAPRYRLAPQFPFPCGLQDALAAYLYLLNDYDPSSILVAGDSAGGGMTLSLLVTLRDQGIPLPAGALLLSPWVDLTHSFPSVSGEGPLDYIPSTGFHHRPSVSWPPPNADELDEVRAPQAPKTGKLKKRSAKQKENEAVLGVRISDDADALAPAHIDPLRLSTQSTAADVPSRQASTVAEMANIAPQATSVHEAGPNLSIELDGHKVEILDQIQMYTTNQLLAHPLVSPVMQPSLGGLPPLLIQTGGGELLADEQIYIAHKAANPSAYLAPDAVLDTYDPERKLQDKYPPTKVQLQVWEDLCHVPHTLSFTRPAKHMYRAVAQFGNWCYANSAKTHEAQPIDDDALSVISSDTDSESEATDEHSLKTRRSRSVGSRNDPAMRGGESLGATAVAAATETPIGQVAAADPLPPFEHHMIRQLVDRHGAIFPLPPASSLPGCTIPRSSIGAIKPGPVRKWIAKKEQWDRKFASQKRKVQTRRADAMRRGYEKYISPSTGREEFPPPTALAGRRSLKVDLPNLAAAAGAGGKKKSWGLAMWSGWGSKHDSATVDAQADAARSERRSSSVGGRARTRLTRGLSTSAAAPVAPKEGQPVEGTEHTFLAPGSARPHDGAVAYPFKLRADLAERSPSTVTLQSKPGVVSPMEDTSAQGDTAEAPQRPEMQTFVTAREF